MTTLTLDLSYRNPVTDALESNPDSTPNAFSITPQTGVALDSDITSAPITVTGYTIAPISVSGGTYNIDGGSFTSSPGYIEVGQVPRVKVHSSALNSTAATATLTIGGVSADFVVTTVASGGGFVPLVAEDFTSGTLGAQYSTFDSKSVYADDQPEYVGRSLKCGIDAYNPSPDPTTCGGYAFFGGRMDLPEIVPIGNIIWYSLRLYHPSTQTWGYCYTNSPGDIAEAAVCGKEPDGNALLKHMSLVPSVGTAVIYLQPQAQRRTVALAPGFRIIDENGPIYADYPSVVFPLDEWFTLQMCVNVTDQSDGYIRAWINDGFIGQVDGETVVPTGGIARLSLGDYWNGVPYTDGGADRQTFWVRDMIVATDMPGYGAPTGVDGGGRAYIDPTTLASDL